MSNQDPTITPQDNQLDKQPKENPQPRPVAPQKPARTLKQKVGLVLATVLVVLLIFFVVQNLNKTTVNFLMWSDQIRIVYVILLSAIVGSIITFILQRRFRKK